MTEVWAGFEPAHLVHNNRDLATLSRHTPGTDMLAHYQSAMAHGATTMRDGLPWRHDAGERVRAVSQLPVRVIWDVIHFDPPRNTQDHARAVASAIDAQRDEFWLCPVNEPSVWPLLTGRTREAAVRAFREINQTVRDLSPLPVRVLACDPLHGLDGETWRSMDEIVAQGGVDLLGVNYYPHHAREELHVILREADRRYGLPVCVSETSWHQGHEVAHSNYPHVRDRAGWLCQVMNEVHRSGVDVQGVCWYPWLDQVPWHGELEPRWPCGMVG